MTDSYMATVAQNLAHLRILIPPQPKRNLASNSPNIPMTDDDVYLNSMIHWATIPDGQAGTRRTMETMAQMAREATQDPFFVQFARQFSSLGELESWMRNHFVYRDEHEEILRTPVFMLSDMGRTSGTRVVGLEGDCDDASTFLAAAAKAMGYRTRLVAIRYNKTNPDFEHVFTQAFDGGQWHMLDPTIDTDTVIQSIEDMIVTV